VGFAPLYPPYSISVNAFEVQPGLARKLINCLNAKITKMKVKRLNITYQ